MTGTHAPAVPETTPGRTAGAEILARLEVIERTAHKRCADCGRFVPKERWTPKLKDQRADPNASIVQPLCDGCQREYDPPEW